jgi:DNA-binding MarR family transcriptional regulator
MNNADIASLLVSITRSLYKTMRASTPSCSFLEMKTLAIACENKSPSMKEVADDLGISSPALTSIVDKLVDSGQIVRSEDKDDRRIVRISPTASGKKAFDKNKSLIFDAFNKRASVLSEKEQAELIKLLTKLQNNQ